MKDGFRVVDADRHIIEPEDLWDRYIDVPYRGRVKITKGRSGRYIDGEPLSFDFGAKPGGGFASNVHYRNALSYAVEHDYDAASNVHDMDLEGVDVGVLFPTVCLYVPWKDDIPADLSAAICRAYNTWMAEYCSYDPARLRGVALIPLHDTDLAIRELRRAKEELGLVGIFWRPNPLKGRKFDHEDYLPIYEAASDLGMLVCVHEGQKTVLPQAGFDRYTSATRHIASHPFEQMLACMTFCYEGVLERYPRLRVGFFESGCGWLPYWLYRMDEHWERRERDGVQLTPELPSTYFKRQCMISCESEETLVDVVADEVGDDYIVLATDYPHPDVIGRFPEHTVGDLTRNPKLTRETAQKILWDNPSRLYRISEPAPVA